MKTCFWCYSELFDVISCFWCYDELFWGYGVFSICGSGSPTSTLWRSLLWSSANDNKTCIYNCPLYIKISFAWKFMNAYPNQLHCACISNHNYLLKPRKPIICIWKEQRCLKCNYSNYSNKYNYCRQLFWQFLCLSWNNYYTCHVLTVSYVCPHMTLIQRRMLNIRPKGLFRPRAAISKPHTFKWGPLADENLNTA